MSGAAVEYWGCRTKVSEQRWIVFIRATHALDVGCRPESLGSRCELLRLQPSKMHGVQSLVSNGQCLAKRADVAQATRKIRALYVELYFPAGVGQAGDRRIEVTLSRASHIGVLR